MFKTAVIIPARWASTRFPGKPLHLLAGKPLVQHVWERACRARAVQLVIIATDDMRIAEAAFAFGAEVALTSPRCVSGTDRCAEVARRLEKEGFTHLLCIGWYTKVFWQAIWAAKKDGIKVLSRGDSQLGMQRSLVKRWIKEFVYRPMLRAFDAHLYVGQRNFAYLRHYGVPKDRLFFSPHFVDNQWWAANAERSRKMEDGRSPQPQHAGGWATATPSKIGGLQPPNSHLPTAISEKRTAFLFAGKFIPKKRVMDLLEAAALVPEAKVVLVGDGPLRGQLEARAQKPDLKGRVEFVGFKNQQELPAYLAGTDCLVLPSDGTETWGLIVNEAMACGTPAIVSTACGCEPDLIVKGETGYSFPLGDTHELAECMRGFIRNKNRDWDRSVREKIKAFSIHMATEGLKKAVVNTKL
ncbi:MAG: glycosyltransferase [Verrucomicrobia bacterium]|nr:glycosyltransferase [Verrucomicrobiota bacterium]